METDKLDELLKPDVLGNFTQMAFEFGPFFFSVLILLYVTYRANQYYLQVSTRKDPPPLPEELRARRVVFYSAWVFAFTLVAVSVSWWLYSHAPQRKDYVRFAIVRMDNNSEILRPRGIEEVYLRRVLFQSLKADGSLIDLEDYYFLIPIQDFKSDSDKIIFNYVNIPENVEGELYLQLNEINSKRFRIAVEVESRKAILEEIQ